MARCQLATLRILTSSVGRIATLAVAFVAAAEAQAPEVDYGPDVVVITEPVLTAFAKGLRTEIALRDALRKELAARQTKAQYEQCQMTLMTSPESQKFNEALLSIMSGEGKPEETQRRMQRFSVAMEARVEAKCGPDPGYSNDRETAEQLGMIERKAAAAAGPIP